MRPGAVYSEQAQCQDCYKCLRHCPVKAIQVSGGHAVVMGDRCIACGACVGACPSGAKRVRDDLQGVRALVASGVPVALSLAPSFPGEFPDADPRQVAAALRRLGFCVVSETALGAQEVSAHLAQELDAARGRLWLSSACPVAVDLVRKFHPGRMADLTPLDSPLQAHARLLKRLLGEEVAVVFAGPCIGKKLEVEAAPELLAAALTFEDLHRWLSEAGLAPHALDPSPEEGFWPEEASEGALYPLEGGMVEATRRSMRAGVTRFLTLHGLASLRAGLGERPDPGDGNLFLELLACEGGCARGPCSRKGGSLGGFLRVLDQAGRRVPKGPRRPLLEVARVHLPAPVDEPPVSPTALDEVLARMGKAGGSDELNCGGCGYDTCRDLAAAILAHRAEDRMCVSHLRRLAEKKANALFRTLPYGVVIVDRDLSIIECNHVFAEQTGPDAELVYAAQPGLSGARLEKFLPFAPRFRDVLLGGQEILRENHACGDRTLSVSIFSVEPGRVVGGLLLDVTETERRRQEVITKAEEVIQGMLANVQEIAFSLGRNAARSEGILDSIIQAFASDRREGGHGA